MMFKIVLVLYITSISMTKVVDGHMKVKHIPSFIGGKLNTLVKTEAWKPLEAKGRLQGPLKLLLQYKYQLPTQSYFFPLEYKHPSCRSWMDSHIRLADGVYTIYPDAKTPKKVFCDMTTDGGGWTVFQRRLDGSVDFYRGWNHYRTGFGSASGEYWLGNEAMHIMTQGKGCELRIDMQNYKGIKGYAKYSNFKIDSEAKGYTLHIGTYTGNAGRDSLKYHNGRKFSTKDKDNDIYKGHCAILNHGAWWFVGCDNTSLNGNYRITNSDKGLEWNHFPGGIYMKRVKMMLRCQG